MAKRSKQPTGKHAETESVATAKGEAAPVTGWRAAAKRAAERRRERAAPLERPFGLALGPLRDAVARHVMKPEVDDIVTEAVKEAYASGVDAALEAVRVFCAGQQPRGKNDVRELGLDMVVLELDVIRARLASWKTTPLMRFPRVRG